MQPFDDSASNLNRRSFIVGSLAAVALQAAQPRIDFPSKPRERLAVSSYPFRSLIESPHHRPSDSAKPGMTLQQFAQFIPENFQVHGIEPWSRHFSSTVFSYVHELRDAFKTAGVRVVNIPVDESVHPCADDPDQRKASSETWQKWVDVAVELGSPSIRVHMPGIRSDSDCVLTSFRTLVDYAIQKNIVVNVENDDPVSEQASRIVETIEKVNSPFLHALPDFCNSMLAGDEEYDYRSVTAMFAHAYNISHVKDEEVERGKVYRIDLVRTFAIATKANYRGYFSMEWDGQGDPNQGTRRLIEASLRNLS
jgi:sugar phosphate isomerase/epimerase